MDKNLNNVKEIKAKLKHDRVITVAYATKRTAKKWHNKSTSWSAFVRLLSKTQRTSETMSEYAAMSKQEQADIKDVGGYVGGELINGIRRSDSVKKRDVLTLDIDFPDDKILFNIWELGLAYHIYSTHKHSAEHPRYRLTMPLSESVDVTKYTAIASKVAEVVGIDCFDDTTFEPHRMMFYPSTSRDGEFYSEYEDAPLLNVQEWLDKYKSDGKDWQDPVDWPVSSRKKAVYTKLAKKQGNPLEKPGTVGAFCRAFDIKGAIEMFLPDEYSQFREDRFTYNAGSTVGGLVLYENDNLAYSHHGTDPCSGRLVNSFDLVRIHKFGDLDKDIDVSVPINKLPSYKEMEDFAIKIKAVKVEQAFPSVFSANDDFDVIDESLSDEELTLKAKIEAEDKAADEEMAKHAADLLITKRGLECTVPNIEMILRYDPRVKGLIAYNEFTYRYCITGASRWRKEEKMQNWSDADDAGLRAFLEKYYNFYNKSKTEDAMRAIAFENSFHPIRDYFESLEWDGVERLDKLFITYLGAEDNELTRLATRKAFTAAVARIYKPGIKFDYMPVLYGAQGIGKSAILARLGGTWFSDSVVSVTGKEAYEALSGSWIIEMGELAATKKAEVESIKHFISKQVDSYRVAYGRYKEDFPRQCIFIGTTNKIDFLRDETGGRRFWPISVYAEKREKVWSDITDEIRNQIWAEAKHNFKKGETLYLDYDKELEMRNRQIAHTEESPFEGLIREYLEIPIPLDFYEMDMWERKDYIDNYNSEDSITDKYKNSELMKRQKVCALEIWVECLGNPINKFPRLEQREINAILKKLENWNPNINSKTGRIRFGKCYGAQKAYIRN